MVLDDRKQRCFSRATEWLPTGRLSLPASLHCMIASLHLRGAVAFAQKTLPFFDLGVGWICPALAGLVVGLVWYAFTKNRKAAA